MQRIRTLFLVVGLDETLEGEERDEGNFSGSGDKRDLLLPAPQRELAEKIAAVGKPVVTVLMAGSSIDLELCNDRSDAILDVWYPGAAGGKVVADILFGSISPSGKLPVTFYRNEALNEIGSFTDYSMTNKTYRYYSGKPLYPFGFGLTYGDTRVLDYKINGESISVTAENGGAADTDDVIEVFVKDNKSPYATPNAKLCGFKRVHLASGERKTFDFTLGRGTYTVINADGVEVPGSGDYSFTVSFNNQAD